MKNRKVQLITAALISMVLCLFLTSCPEPLNTSILTVLTDADAPTIVVTSPEDYGEYATVLELTGYIADDSIGSLPEGTNLSVTYSISGTSVSGTADVDINNGGFSTTINVSDISGDKVIELSAEDSNGNTGSARVNICKPDDGGDISGFTLSPGNKQVTISWEPVPNVESYSIYQSDYSETVELDPESTTYTWTGLTNGLEYSFQLTAVIPDDIGDDALSSEETTIPLNSRIFVPSVKEVDYKSITITWNENSDIDSFTVERSTSPDGSWRIVRSNLDNNEYTDSSLENDTTYYYRIRPTDYVDIISDYTTAVPDRFSFELVGSLETVSASGIAVSGDYVYAVGWNSGLSIIDCSNPESPSIEGRYDDLNSYAYDIDYSDGFVYIAEDDYLEIIDCRSPSSPSFESSFTAENSINVITVSGDYAYVYGEDEDLYKINITEPENPAVDASRPLTGGEPHEIVVDGDYAYIATGDYFDGGLYIYDISSQGSISKMSDFNDGDEYRYNYGLAVSGDYAYVTYADTLWVADCSDPTDLSIAGIYDGISSNSRVALSGNYAYVLDTNLGLLKINCNDPSAPVFQEKCTTSGSSDIKVSGNYAFVASSSYGLEIFDITVPDAPVLEGSDESISEAYDLVVSGNYAYVADEYFGLKISDITDPESPMLVGSCETYNYDYEDVDRTFDVAIAGNYAYVVNQSSGLKIIDCSTVSSPTIIGSYELDNYTYSVTVAGEYAYLSNEDSGLVILDITEPASPTLAGSCTTSGYAYGVAVIGDYAYVADDSSGLQIIDINPYSSDYCTIVANCTTSDARDVVIAGDYAYIADGWSGLQIIDIDPNSDHFCTIVSSCDTSNTAEDVAVAGGYAFIADNTAGLQIIDIYDPEAVNLHIIGNYNYPYRVSGVAVAGSYAYLATDSSGLQVINLRGE
ncbi:MAG: hypothetical protein PQJ61_11105 [Spirochaetales bacterium]|uniref:Fibronectin type-III domain-containing protein n=1 Tax=Candidatus Thalassospirochaeta sargassi TaxID=3119039 RepID=A0AAJ1MJC5_9SPIO|nr:hypothetical protein [Spirochaetales bacterium]